MASGSRPAVREMVKEAAEALGGQTTNVAVRDWILKKYPNTNPRTIGCTIILCTVNHASRIHYPENQRARVARDQRYDFLFRTGRGQLQLYDPKAYGEWAILELEDGGVAVSGPHGVVATTKAGRSAVADTGASVCSLVNEVRDLINRPVKHYVLRQDRALYHQLCSCLDVIEDTDSAITGYVEHEFEDTLGNRYLATYGVLQALAVQGDALVNLFESLGLSKVALSGYKGLSKARNVRVEAVGHPTKRDRPRPATYHHIEQISLGHGGFRLWSFDDSGKDRVEAVNALDLIEQQKADVCDILRTAITALETEEAKRMAGLDTGELSPILDECRGYPLGKVFEAIGRPDYAPIGIAFVGRINELLHELVASLAKMGHPRVAYDGVDHACTRVEQALAGIDSYFNDVSEGREPRLSHDDAYIFAEFVAFKLDELSTVIREIAGDENA